MMIQASSNDTLSAIDRNGRTINTHIAEMDAERVCLNIDDVEFHDWTLGNKFASGDTKDVVALNVSGTIMVTMRSTLCTAEDSVLAQQFDDSKWTEQGCNAPRVNEWTPDQVSTWAESIGVLLICSRFSIVTPYVTASKSVLA